MKTVLIAAACGVLLALGLTVAYVVYQHYQEPGDISGSSTEEFVTTEPPVAPPPPPPPPPTTTRRNPALDRVDWPTFGLDEARLRNLQATGLKPPYKVLWSFRARQLLEFPPAVAYGRLYIANNPGVVFAIQAATGRVSWRYKSGRCTAMSPAVFDELVFVTFLNTPPCNRKPDEPGLTGQLVALDARNGTLVWKQTIGPSESSPAVANGLVYVGDWRGRVYAFEVKTGRERWRFQTGAEVKAAVAISGRRLYVGSYDHHVYALNAKTGKLIWRAGAQDRIFNRGRFYSTPAAAYGRVFVGATDGKVYSFGATTGRLIWAQDTGGYVYGSPAIWKQRVLVGSYGNDFFAFDAATGKEIWKFDARGRISGSGVVLGNHVYFSTLNERTFALDARTGKPVWSFRDGKYGAVVAGPDRLYLVGHTRVYAMVPK